MANKNLTDNDATNENETSVNVLSPVRGKVLVCELCNGLFIQNPGDSTIHTLDIGPVLHNVGQLVEDAIAHVVIQDKTTNFAMNVRGTYSYQGKNFFEYGPFWTGADLAANGYHISNAYTDRSKFGFHMGFRITLPTSATVESARVSVKVALKFAT